MNLVHRLLPGTIIRKSFTTTADLIVKKTVRTGEFVLTYIYTEDPTEKITNTLAFSPNDQKPNHVTITSKRHHADGSLEIITEIRALATITIKPPL